MAVERLEQTPEYATLRYQVVSPTGERIRPCPVSPDINEKPAVALVVETSHPYVNPPTAPAGILPVNGFGDDE
jgi:hypothetical protein